MGVCLSISAQAYTIVIDAGHGGKDAGAIGRISQEKNINLAVAKELGRLIEQNMPGTKVVYTRKTDVFVELHERAQIANRAKADLFISIHTNSTAALQKTWRWPNARIPSSPWRTTSNRNTKASTPRAARAISSLN